VLIQLYGVACTVVYCAIATLIILKVIDVIIGLRASEEVERDGLDLNLHGEIVH
jgi:Amt family ammonium transporter